MASIKAMPKGKSYSIAYNTLRNISSPEDLANDRKTYVGQLPLKAIIDFPTDENVRDYLLDAEGRMKRRETAVHKAIKDTLINYPDRFSVLNSGITIVASEISIDEKERLLTLQNPSIINGAQTQGVIRDFFDDGWMHDDPIHIKCEIILTKDDALIGDISIARNFQNDVMSISIAGRKGQLDELAKRIESVHPELKLRKSETQFPNGDYIDTEKLLQVITALMPAEIWPKISERDNPNKVFTYSQKSKCLKDFQDLYVRAKNDQASGHSEAIAAYQFFLDIAPTAYSLYNKWKSHQGFYGTKLRDLGRDEKGKITDIPDGIIFPIISSFSVFIQQGKKGWSLELPKQLSDEEIIRAAKSVYMEMASSNPQTMGKSKACYSALLQITSIYSRLLK